MLLLLLSFVFKRVVANFDSAEQQIHTNTHTHVYRYSNVFIVIIPGFGIDAVCLFVCFFLLVFSIRYVTTMNDSVSLSVSVDLAAITYANQASHVEDLLNEENNPMKCIYCFAHLAER